MRSAAARGGLSESVWRQIEKGRRILHPDLVVAPTPSATTKYKVAKALRWPPEAIDLLLAGSDPSAGQAPTEPADANRVAASLSDVVAFLTPDEQEQLADIAQTFLARRRAAEDPDQP